MDHDEREYLAEMGFDAAEREAYYARKFQRQLDEQDAALMPYDPSRENGGPSDYAQEAR